MIKTYSLKKDGNQKLAENFRVKEFLSQDGTDRILIDTDLIAFLQKIRDCLRLSSMKVVSGYRSAAYNKQIGGSVTSKHMQGKAADVCGYRNGRLIEAKYLCCAAEVLGMTGIALIQTCVHLDTRPSRSWFDENKGNTRISVYGSNSWFHYCKVNTLTFMKNPFPCPSSALRKGMRGDTVKWLQFQLILNGFMPLLNENGASNIDGSFGSGTDLSVRAAQAKYNLVVDGVVGSATRQVL